MVRTLSASMVLLVIVCLIFTPLFGQVTPGPPGFNVRPVEAFRVVRLYLGLTQQQEAQWQAVFNAKHQAYGAFLFQQGSIYQQIQEELRAPTPDLSKIGELVVQEHEARQRHNELTREYAEQMRSILTAEQVAKLETAAECLRIRHVPDALIQTGFLPTLAPDLASPFDITNPPSTDPAPEVRSTHPARRPAVLPSSGHPAGSPRAPKGQSAK